MASNTRFLSDFSNAIIYADSIDPFHPDQKTVFSLFFKIFRFIYKFLRPIVNVIANVNSHLNIKIYKEQSNQLYSIQNTSIN